MSLVKIPGCAALLAAAMTCFVGCAPAVPTQAELEDHCNSSCERLEGLGCPPDDCVSNCVDVVHSAVATHCEIELEAMQDCIDSQPDAVACDTSHSEASCADEINTYLHCQSGD